MEVPSGTGSGFVWDDKGHIVTNYHVIRQAQSAQVAILTKYREEDLPAPSGTATSLNSKYKRANENNNSLPVRSSMRPGNPGVVDFTRRVYKARVVGIDPGKVCFIILSSKFIVVPCYLYPGKIGYCCFKNRCSRIRFVPYRCWNVTKFEAGSISLRNR